LLGWNSLPRTISISRPKSCKWRFKADRIDWYEFLFYSEACSLVSWKWYCDVTNKALFVIQM
jgi:hypothetical protein